MVPRVALTSQLLSERQERDGSGSLDRNGQLALVSHAVAGDPARHDPASLRQKTTQQTDVLEVDRSVIMAKSASSPSLEQSWSFHAFPPLRITSALPRRQSWFHPVAPAPHPTPAVSART